MRSSTSIPLAATLRTLAFGAGGGAPKGLPASAVRARKASLNALTSGEIAPGLNRSGSKGLAAGMGEGFLRVRR